ncbi:hypothetical protein S2091_3283 [Solimicrobium silvestre]|uniref:Uncharacterized protein n=1 Tax=Solimicrobium silvestre TaxID=2099400 RepID=A0A2S9GW62_9BURK|nr:hypothetical protein S2091_3283 [Solimicrobium silvestre]
MQIGMSLDKAVANQLSLIDLRLDSSFNLLATFYKVCGVAHLVAQYIIYLFSLKLMFAYAHTNELTMRYHPIT